MSCGSYPSRRVLVAAAAVLAALSSFLPAVTAGPGPVTGAAAPSASPDVSPSPTPILVPVFNPTRIEVPSLGVNAPIIAVEVDEQGAMGTPATPYEVAWWDGISVGGGNAQLAGHRNWNGVQGAFAALETLKPGDVVNVYGERYQLGFRVQWVRQMARDADAAEVLGPTTLPALTMITCGGQFDRRIRHYKDRIVVRAVIAL